MPEITKTEIAVISALTGALVMDLYHTRRNKKIRKAVEEIVDHNAQLVNQVNYMGHMIIRNEVPLTEFDLIALQDICNVDIEIVED